MADQPDKPTKTVKNTTFTVLDNIVLVKFELTDGTSETITMDFAELEGFMAQIKKAKKDFEQGE